MACFASLERYCSYVRYNPPFSKDSTQGAYLINWKSKIITEAPFVNGLEDFKDGSLETQSISFGYLKATYCIWLHLKRGEGVPLRQRPPKKNKNHPQKLRSLWIFTHPTQRNPACDKGVFFDPQPTGGLGTAAWEGRRSAKKRCPKDP